MNGKTYAALLLLSLLGISSGASGALPSRPALTVILKEKKFLAHGNYTGADTLEDRQPLQKAVDDAIRDIGGMANPLQAALVRSRLEQLLADTDAFATEDRDEVGRYAIRIWRAAGFKGDSGLFPVGDDRASEPL